MKTRVKSLLAINVTIAAVLLVLLALRLIPFEPRPVAASDQQQLSDTSLHGGLTSRFKQSKPIKTEVVAESNEHANPLTGARIALVVDDLGFSSSSPVVQGMLSLPVPITASIIPGQAGSVELAHKAHEMGYAVLAHVPMQPLNPPANSNMNYLTAGMSDEKFDAFMENVDDLPYASGLSNHQGSAATQDAALMRHVAQWCSQRDWYIFDSITHPGTLLYRSALAQGVPAVRRDIFLDHHQDSDSIRARLRDAADLAVKRQGIVFVIAHPREQTLEVLTQELPGLMEQGIKFVRLSDGMDQKLVARFAGE